MCILPGFRNRLLLLTLALFMITGCSAPGLDLSLKTPLAFQKEKCFRKTLDLSIGVATFVDMRPQIRGSENQKWLGYIPGVLWVDIGSEMPEIYTAYSPYNSKPMQDNLTEAIASGLSDSEAFREVIYLAQDPYRVTDYRLEGILKRSRVIERGYYYGSSVYAWLLRVLGLPYVSYDVNLEADLRLRDMNSLEVIWRGRIKGQRTDKYNSVYKLAGGREGKQLIAYNFSRILHGHLPGLIEEVFHILEKHKNSLESAN